VNPFPFSSIDPLKSRAVSTLSLAVSRTRFPTLFLRPSFAPVARACFTFSFSCVHLPQTTAPAARPCHTIDRLRHGTVMLRSRRSSPRPLSGTTQALVFSFAKTRCSLRQCAVLPLFAFFLVTFAFFERCVARLIPFFFVFFSDVTRPLLSDEALPLFTRAPTLAISRLPRSLVISSFFFFSSLPLPAAPSLHFFFCCMVRSSICDFFIPHIRHPGSFFQRSFTRLACCLTFFAFFLR